MDERLFEAARTGNITILKELLEEDPLILDDINIETVAGETPLHIVSLLGHIDFVREVINQNPGFARRVNKKGYSPLHLASSNGQVEVVRELLKIDHETEHELCLRKDRKGRTALHHATIKGRIIVMSELICACPNSAFELTDHGETVLHLTVKSENGCKALKVLVEGIKSKELLNYRDEDGNTILHLAIEKKQNQTIKYLLSQASLDINAVNANGLTALDILLTSPKQSNDTEIKQMLLAAKGVKVNPKTQPHLPPTEHQIMCKIIDIEPNESNSSSASQAVEKSDEWTREMRRVIMVMVVLIATVTFEVALNPPGGVWQDGNAQSNATKSGNGGGHRPGTAVMSDMSPANFKWFLAWDSIGFLASMSIIIALMSPTTMNGVSIRWEYVKLMMWVVVVSVHMVFLYGIKMTTNWNVFREAVVTPFVFFYVVVGVFALSMGWTMVSDWWHMASKLWKKKNE